MLISLLVGIVSTEGSKRLTRRETAAVSAVTAGAAVKEDDFSPAENTTADSPDKTADVTTTNQLDQSYSVLLKSLSVGQSDGPITATTWLAALACMLVISLMGLLAVGCLPLLQGPRFESSSLCS